MTTDPIKALVDLEPELQRKLRTDHNICLFSDELKAILAAIEALRPVAEGAHVIVPNETIDETFLRLKGVQTSTLKPMADVVMVPRDLLKQVVTFDRGYDCGCINISRQMETAYETGQCPHQKLRAMLAAAPPASPAPSDEGRVEKVRKILEEIETETNRATREFHGNSYSAAFANNRARAALAAIKEGE